MKPIRNSIFLFLAAAVSSVASVTKRQAASNPTWAGVNNRMIHGVKDRTGLTAAQLQDKWASDLAAANTKVVRLFIDPAYGCQDGLTTTGVPGLEQDTLGQYDDTILQSIDFVLGILHNHGIKAIISPHNGNDIESEKTQNNPTGRDVCDSYCAKYTVTRQGISAADAANFPYDARAFYTDQEAIDFYDARLSHILNYASPAFGGAAWKTLSQVIEGFDVQNEPFIARSTRYIPGGTQNLVPVQDPDVNKWICDRAGTIRTLLGADSPIQILTGGIAGNDFQGNTYSFLPSAVACANINVIAIHAFRGATDYPTYTYLDQQTQETLQTSGKGVLMEEFGVGTNAIPTTDYDPIVTLLRNVGMPFLYWEYLGGVDDSIACGSDQDACCGQGLDGYGIGFGSTKQLSTTNTGIVFGEGIASAQYSPLNATGMKLN